MKRFLALLLFCPLFGYGQAASINGATTVQYISGFGGSTGFNEQNPNMTAAEADCFFSTTNVSCASETPSVFRGSGFKIIRQPAALPILRPCNWPSHAARWSCSDSTRRVPSLQATSPATPITTWRRFSISSRMACLSRKSLPSMSRSTQARPQPTSMRSWQLLYGLP